MIPVDVGYWLPCINSHLPREVVDTVIAKCPEAQWRLIVALSRYAGLRYPLETFALRWVDVDWETHRITVRSKKTARQGKSHRVIPIVAELRPYLEEAYEVMDNDVHNITRYRGNEKNLRTSYAA